MKFYHLSLLKVILFYITVTSNQIKSTEISENLKAEIYLYLWKIISNITKSQFNFDDILNDNLFKICQEKISNISNDRLPLIFSYCGKGLSELGDEKECIKLAKNQKDNDFGYEKDLTYFQLVYSMDYDVLNDEEDEVVVKFIDQKKYYTGICMVSDCMPILNKIFNNNERNNTLYNSVQNYLKSYGINNTTIREGQTKKNKDNNINSNVYKILMGLVMLYFLIKIGASLIRILFINEGYDQVHLKKKINKQEQEIAMEMNAKASNYANKENNKSRESSMIFSMGPNQVVIDSAREEGKDYMKYPLYLRTIKFLDFIDNLIQISKIKGTYFNEKRLETIVILRVILIFFIVLNHNIYTLNQIPGRDFLSIDFYERWEFFIIKFSSYSSTCWIMLDGLVFAYKFMFYIQKQMNKEHTNKINFLWIFKFFTLIIPKVVIFLIGYFLFGVYSGNIATFSNESALFEFYQNDILNDKECINKPFSIFIPFINSYYRNTAVEFSDENFYFNNCFKFVNILMNEFYCFIFLLLLVYISFKLKSKIFDYGYLIIILINTALQYFSIKWCSKLNPDYNFKNVLGHNIAEKLTHLFLNTYSFGFFLGLSYFYYHDSVINNSIVNNNDFYPFSFCFDFVKFIDALSYKQLLFWINSFIIVIYSFSFYFALKIHGEKALLISFDNAPGLVFFFYYEKVIFSILFIFFIVLFLVYPREDNSLENNMAVKVILPLTRTSTAFICLNDTLIYVSYCIFVFEVKLSYINLINLTIGLIVIIFFICFGLMLMFEFPIKIFVKHMLRSEGGKREEEESNILSLMSIEDEIKNKIN